MLWAPPTPDSSQHGRRYWESKESSGPDVLHAQRAQLVQASQPDLGLPQATGPG